MGSVHGIVLVVSPGDRGGTLRRVEDLPGDLPSVSPKMAQDFEQARAPTEVEGPQPEVSRHGRSPHVVGVWRVLSRAADYSDCGVMRRCVVEAPFGALGGAKRWEASFQTGAAELSVDTAT